MISEAIPAQAWLLLAGTLVTAIASVVVALIGVVRSGQARQEATAGRQQAESNNVAAAGRSRDMLEKMDTGNGHTLGAGVANLEARVAALHDRQDAMDVVLRETTLVAREGRDAATRSADALLTHLKDVDTDIGALFKLKGEWDAAKYRVQLESDQAVSPRESKE